MDERMIFAILNIERTKDEDAIRAAYRTLLKETNPEDDPEGFKRLREAYEKALEYAKTTENAETTEQEDMSPVGMWMQQVKAVYFSLPRRLDEAEWKELVHDDICMDLEYGEEAKWQFFSFLAEHYHLKSNIYRILNETYGITEDVEVFKEHLPVGFVDFMLQKIGDTTGNMNFDYEDFRGAHDADYDIFLNYYNTLCDQTQNEDGASAAQTVRAMEDMDIYHPLFYLEKARTLVLCGEREEAVSLLLPLMEEKKDGLRIQILGAEVLYKCGLHEEAQSIFERYTEGGYFLVEKYLTLCEQEKGNQEKAIKHCVKALKNGNDEELEALLQELDRSFIEQYASHAESGLLTDEEAICLMGSYSRTNRAQEALDFLEHYPNYAVKMERLHEYRCALYYQLEQYHEGIAESRHWRELLTITKESGAEEQICRSYTLEGDGWFKLGKQNEDEAYIRAQEAYKAALFLDPDNLNLKQKIMDAAMELKNYEEAVLLADEVIAVNGRWFPAYVQKQKACFELHRAQEVVNCFYDAKHIYAGYAPIYEKAAEVFWIYRQYQDAEGIVEQARQANVTSIMLDVIALRCMRIKEVNELEELRRQGRMGDFKLHKDLTEAAETAKKKYTEAPGEASDMYTLFEELGLLERDRKHFKGAAGYFKKALKYEDNANGHYLLANALFDNGQKKEALEEYCITENMSGPEEYLYINMARCYRADGQKTKAIETFKKVLTVNPENDEANGAIVRLYREMMVDTGNRYYGRLAKPFADRQLELMPEDGYYLRERGLLLMEMNCFEEALADFEHALQVEPEPYGYNLKGKALYYLGKYSEAVIWFKKAIQEMDEKEQFIAPYLNIGDSMRRLGKTEDAEQWYRAGINKSGKTGGGSLYNNLYWLYRVDGRFEEAKEVLNEQRKAKKMDEEVYERLVLNIDQLIHREKGTVYIERASELARKYNSIDAWLELSYQYQYEADNLYKALEAVLQAFQIAAENKRIWDKYTVLLQIIEIYSLLEEKELAHKHGEIFLSELKKAYSYNEAEDAEKQFMEHLQADKDNVYDLARVYLGMGELEKAEKCLDKLMGPGFCRKCNKKGCTEALHLKAMICEVKGDMEGAFASYQAAIHFDKGMRESIYRINRLKMHQEKKRVEEKAKEKAKSEEKGLFSFFKKIITNKE